MSEIMIYGLDDDNKFESELQRILLEKRPSVIGMATAYLSLPGARWRMRQYS